MQQNKTAGKETLAAPVSPGASSPILQKESQNETILKFTFSEEIR
jgi:hypothetical protein